MEFVISAVYGSNLCTSLMSMGYLDSNQFNQRKERRFWINTKVQYLFKMILISVICVYCLIIIKEFDPPRGLTTVIVVDQKEEKIYTHSDAVALICKYLSFPWPIVYYIRLCMPKVVADFLYIQFAQRRYQ